ncbi:MAG TPA: hypothetical protein VM638_01140 [Actinomycetota bacterium]|nr:hypothetical protein [Actinomycetota bacterium]
MRALLLPFLSAALLAACTTSGGTGDDDDDGSSPTPTPTWSVLMTGDWTLPAYSEDTADVHQKTMDRTVYIGGIRPIAPLGTHHTVLYLGSPAGTNMIYASGVGTGEIVFPEGVGLKLNQGQLISLELHIFNTSDTELSGTSGVEILEVSAADVEQEADIFLPGPLSLSIPPSQTHTVTDPCVLNAPANFFAIFPHMHQLGTHFKTTLTINGTTRVLHDAPYYFDQQYFTPFTPIAMGAGDTITTECTWNNTTTQTVEWGESSNEEMCFSILYRWPAQAATFCF